MKNLIKQTVSQLANLTETQQVATPFFTRFKTEGQFQILPVMKITTNERHCVVRLDGTNEIIFQWSDILEVVAFQDSNGKLIFLEDESTKKGLAEKEIEINVQNTEYENARILCVLYEIYRAIDALNRIAVNELSIRKPKIYHFVNQMVDYEQIREEVTVIESLYEAA